MRLAVSGKHRRVLARGAAIVFVAGAAAGCSSDVTRFQDSILTGSSRPQQAAPVHQPFPGDYAQLDQTTTASVQSAPRRGGGILSRAGLNPRPYGDVGGYAVAAAPTQGYPAQQAYPAVQQAQPVYTQPSRQAVTTGSALAPAVTRSSLDATVTGSTPPSAPLQPAPQAMPSVQTAQALPASGEGGWSRAGGTQVSIKQGETVYNLSRRFGVPVDAILKANGMSSPDALAAGQQVVIPTYVHSARAPVSAPDSNPNVADARSSTGTRYDVPLDRAPVPGQVPADRVAVLPQQPQVREQAPGQQTASPDPQRAGAGGGTYTVVSGDTLDAIARRTGTSSAALKQANGLSSGMIRIGQQLTIPAGGTAVAARPAADQTTTASVPPAAQAPANQPAAQQAEKVIQQASLDTTAAPDATGISRMRWPVRGRVVSGFGGSSGGKRNDGIDISVPSGTPVRAAENGVVIYAGDGLKEFGNTVLVRHENGLVTVYGHASEINVQRGQQVRRGDEIAKSGMTGSADTPKLHFEVRKDSTPVDPSTYLE